MNVHKRETSATTLHAHRLRFIVLGGLLTAFSTFGLASGANSANSPSHGLLLVANKGDHTLGIIDPSSAKQIATVPEDGVTGHEVAASPDGKTAYVPIYGNSGVGKPGTNGEKMVAIDIASRAIKGTVDFGHGVRPHCPVIGPKDGMVYVTTELDQTVSIIDPQSLKIMGSIPTGQPESHMLALSHDGRRGYTANVGPGTVSVLDIQGRKTIAVIPISKNTQRIAISPDDRMVFTADQITPRLAVIDTATDKVKNWVDLPVTAYGTAPTLDGRWLVVTLPKAHKVGIVDLHSMQLVHTVDVPATPQAAVVRPDNKIVYVSCDKDHKIAAISVGDWSVQSVIDAGADSDGLAWAR